MINKNALTESEFHLLKCLNSNNEMEAVLHGIISILESDTHKKAVENYEKYYDGNLDKNIEVRGRLT